MKSPLSHSILLFFSIVTPSTRTRQTVAKFQPCKVLDVSFHYFACALSTFSPPDSSPNYTSWPCSIAPSPWHIATRASKVGGQMEGSKGSCFRFSNTSPRHRAHLGSLAVSSAGMDASAQTGSHELTIPNDVSPISALNWNFTYSTHHFVPLRR